VRGFYENNGARNVQSMMSGTISNFELNCIFHLSISSMLITTLSADYDEAFSFGIELDSLIGNVLYHFIPKSANQTILEAHREESSEQTIPQNTIRRS
jgi:hypothetical protein